MQAVFSEGGYATNEPRDFEGDASTGGLGPSTGIYYPKLKQQQEQPLSVCRAASVRTLTHKLVFRTDPQVGVTPELLALEEITLPGWQRPRSVASSSY